MIKAAILSHLQTFDVAAEHGSFTKAAAQLHVTTGAISQQIRLLEDQLGFPLFERHSRGISLTSSGHQLHRVVNSSLKDISTTINSLRQKNTESGVVRLKLTPSFAYKWLVPRLHQFYQQFPEIRVQTYAEGALVNAKERNFDLAIDYGRHPYPDANAECILVEQLIPVMSPEYMARFNWNDKMCWQDVVLLHDAMPWYGSQQDEEWRQWFDQNDLPETDSDRGHFFNRTDMAMAAAEAGLGVALGRLALVDRDFETEKLVSPFKPKATGTGYYLLQTTDNTATQCFKDWLKSELQL